jgi:hypothetical protein
LNNLTERINYLAFMSGDPVQNAGKCHLKGIFPVKTPPGRSQLLKEPMGYWQNRRIDLNIRKPLTFFATVISGIPTGKCLYSA